MQFSYFFLFLLSIPRSWLLVSGEGRKTWRKFPFLLFLFFLPLSDLSSNALLIRSRRQRQSGHRGTLGKSMLRRGVSVPFVLIELFCRIFMGYWPVIGWGHCICFRGWLFPTMVHQPQWQYIYLSELAREATEEGRCWRGSKLSPIYRHYLSLLLPAFLLSFLS